MEAGGRPAPASPTPSEPELAQPVEHIIEPTPVVHVVHVKPIIVRKPIGRIIEKPVIAEVPAAQSEGEEAQPQLPVVAPPTPEVVVPVAAKPEEKSSKQPEMEEKSSGSEEKSSKPEVPAAQSEGGSSKRRKLKKFSGAGGRIHTEAQIDEILDFWLMTGELPNYVSERQRWSYRHHERVPERRELLEQRGISIVANIPGATGHTPAVIPIERAKSQRKTGTSE